MIALLSDPWFEAEFYGEISADDSFRRIEGIEGAQGLILWCPCGYGKPEYPIEGGRPHAILVPFRNPRGAPAVPPGHGPIGRSGAHPRWQMTGNGIADLTLTPSIDVGGGTGGGSCWHGFITNGQIS